MTISRADCSSVYQSGTYSAWLKNCDERDVLEGIFERRMPEYCGVDHLSIVEIGCGLGSAAMRLFSVLENMGQSYDYTGVDPFREQLDRFRELACDRHLHLLQDDFEHFDVDRKYDVGLVVHSLYYAPSIPSAIAKMQSLSDRMVIVHHGKRGINYVHERFPQHVNAGLNTITTYDFVAEVLAQQGIDFELEEHESQLDISSCKVGSIEGLDLIKFFLEDERASEEAIGDVRNYMLTLPDIIPHDIGVFFTK